MEPQCRPKQTLAFVWDARILSGFGADGPVYAEDWDIGDEGRGGGGSGFFANRPLVIFPSDDPVDAEFFVFFGNVLDGGLCPITYLSLGQFLGDN